MRAPAEPGARKGYSEILTEVLVAGGGLGGVACALSALRLGRQVTLVEELDWLGGQASCQGIPFDEFPWNEAVSVSRTYDNYKRRIRDFYRNHVPLSYEARARTTLNPGMGYVSSLSHDPRISALVLDELLLPFAMSGQLRLLRHYRVATVHEQGDAVTGATFRHVHDASEITVHAKVVVDCTETGDLIHRAGIEHVVGAESRADTGELHALEVADPTEQQGFNWAFAVDYLEGEDHTIDKPAQYEFWKDWRLPYWPGPHIGMTQLDHFSHQPVQRKLFAGDTDAEVLRDAWHFRRIARRQNFAPGYLKSDISVFCSMQNEYLRRPLLDVDDEAAALALAEARQLSLSYLYFLQTAAPRDDGGVGYPGLRLRADVFGTTDGLAKQPYTREGRRIVPEFRLLEQHVGVQARPGARSAENFHDTIGIAAYRLNIHPSARRDTSDIDCFPYQLPLGMLIPQRAENFVAGCCKTVGGTRVTNGSLRHHPIDWVIGEAAGALAAHAVEADVPPRAVRQSPERLDALQRSLLELGMCLRWPEFTGLSKTHAMGKSMAELNHWAYGPAT